MERTDETAAGDPEFDPENLASNAHIARVYPNKDGAQILNSGGEDVQAKSDGDVIHFLIESHKTYKIVVVFDTEDVIGPNRQLVVSADSANPTKVIVQRKAPDATYCYRAWLAKENGVKVRDLYGQDIISGGVVARRRPRIRVGEGHIPISCPGDPP